ncbi:MAG: HIT family protein [Parvibaculum sp.]
MANSTQQKFDYPQSLIAETPYWSLQTRRQQPALGAVVLICKEPATAFGQLSAAAFADLQGMIAAVERMLGGFVAYERINYLMLMMVDPDVHFHVIPRYSILRIFEEIEFNDAGWPGPPALAEAVALTDAQLDALTTHLRVLWERGVH